jgi:hypothetical protein
MFFLIFFIVSDTVMYPGQAILSVGIRQNMAGIRSGCMQFRSYPTIGIRLKGFRQLTAEIRPRLFGSDGIRLGIIDLGMCRMKQQKP